MTIFSPSTHKIEKLATLFREQIIELESIFNKDTCVYIDYGNIFRWLEQLKWKIDLKRLIQFFQSFLTIKKVNLYYGTISSNPESIKWISDIKS